MGKIINKIFTVLLLAIISGCGGGGGGDAFTGEGSGGGGGDGTTTVHMGSGTGNSFMEGELALGLDSLSAGGITGVTASLVDASGNPYTTAVDVSFSSPCAGLGLAQLDSPVTTNNGVATSNYRALGCSGDDTITATAIPVLGGATLRAEATVNVLEAVLGSIEFVSAAPTNIALQGTGGAGRSETSTVIFRVKDANGATVAGQDVGFTLNTDVGGIQLNPLTATTLNNGTVQTTVTSGTVATVVRVTALIPGTEIATQSDQLVVSSGTPDQNSFSISAENLNPEAFDIDGAVVPITLRVSDHFNNPVPDGTAVSFTTEGGQVGSSCFTADGACSVNWTSSDPRPLDGRVTILATAIGEESFVDDNGDGRLSANAEPFIDLNNNGVFDAGEPFTDRNGDLLLNPERFADLGEAFRDDNENDAYDIGEPFLDFNNDGNFDGPDGKYNGLLCTDDAKAPDKAPDAIAICDDNAPKTLNVRASIVLVMSGSTLSITPSPTTVTLDPGGAETIAVTVSDFRNQVPPSGTTITVTASDISTVGSTSFTVPNTSSDGPFVALVTVKHDGTAGTGFLSIEATTPGEIRSIGPNVTVTKN